MAILVKDSANKAGLRLCSGLGVLAVGCAGWAGTVAKRAKNALENCPAGSPKQWVQLAEHRLEKSVLSNE
jgi:hypothetical protein